MKIALIAPPYIPVPPPRYGGTELFIAQLATTLHNAGHSVMVYANGQSRLPCEVRWRNRKIEWPIVDFQRSQMIALEHLSWALKDATAEGVDVIHVNDSAAVYFSNFTEVPLVLTLHHPHEPVLSESYSMHPVVHYVAISHAQARVESMPRLSVIYHGIDVNAYRCRDRARSYFAFLGRIAPCKGAHLAVQVAQRAGIPLKLAGEIQPIFKHYWESEVKPFVDGRLIEYVGEADLAMKNDLLGGARALLFTIDWEEPFGLVMIEAMACGAPVLAFNRGSVPEIVEHGLTGWVCGDLEEMVRVAGTSSFDSYACRTHVEERFSVHRMVRDYETLYRHAVRRREIALAS
jgi:glycosyltransferase involved in cell wall biosynthesis